MTTLKTSFARAAMLLLLAVFTTTTARATDYFTDLMLIGGSESEIATLKSQYQSQGWSVIDYDLNLGCSSTCDHTYLLYKTQSSNGINFAFISNLYLRNDVGNRPPESFRGNDGYTYYRIQYDGSTRFVANMGSLNSGTAGEDCYLFYTRDYPNRGVTSISFDATKTDALALDGTWGTGYDLNKGCGSSSAYIYLHADFAVATTYTVTLNAGSPGGDVQYIYRSNDPDHVASTGSAAANCQFYPSGNSIYFKLEPTYDEMLTPTAGYLFNGWGWGNGTHHQLTSATTTKSAQWINGADLSKLTGNYTAQDGDVLTGMLGGNYKISIADGATVTLRNATINGVNNSSYDWAGINCLGDATIVLEEGSTNIVKGFESYYPGIYVPQDKTLTIKGSGTLNASSNGYGAGIGGGYYYYTNSNCGNIIIEGGTITATGGIYAAGIGSSRSSKCGNIEIRGGNITANGDNRGAGIGSGNDGPCGNITISGGTVTATGGTNSAGIGSGSSASCGNITISGGTVTATGGPSGAGIGSGSSAHCGNIDIHNGTVTATGGQYSAGIGSSDKGSCGTIQIDNCTVTATGGIRAPGIGSGIYGSCSGITITNNKTSVTATKGDYAPNSIGAGDDGSCNAVRIGSVLTGDITESPFVTYPYKVTFNANDGTVKTEITVFMMYNVPQKLRNNTFTNSNAAFGYWNTQANGSGTDYANGQTVSNLTSTQGGTITLYAQWQGSALADGTPYKASQDGTAATATYTRTLGSDRIGKHQSWLVPFDYTIKAADLEKFSFYKINMIANSPTPSQDATDEIWVFLKPVEAGTTLHANMPYVFKPKEAVTNYTFTSSNVTLKAKNTGVIAKTETMEDTYEFYGTYENTKPSSSDPFYYININGGISLGNSNSVTVGPYRWIIRKESKFGDTTSYAPAMRFFDDEEDDDPTSIQTTDNGQQTTEATWFDLNGRKLSGKPSQKGIYIRNGRKVAVK